MTDDIKETNVDLFPPIIFQFGFVFDIVFVGLIKLDLKIIFYLPYLVIYLNLCL